MLLPWLGLVPLRAETLNGAGAAFLLDNKGLADPPSRYSETLSRQASLTDDTCVNAKEAAKESYASEALVRVTPASLSFAPTAVGQMSYRKVVRVTNTAAQSLPISTVAVRGPFQILTNK